MCEAHLPRAQDPFALYRGWWADLPSRLGEKTVRQYRYDVLRAMAELGRNPILVKKSELVGYLGGLRTQYAIKARCALKDFFEFLVRRGIRPTNPLEQVDIRRRGGRRVKRGLTAQELVQLVVAATSAPRPRVDGQMTGTRLAWSVLAQYALGLRPGELCGLTPEKVNLDGVGSCVYVTDTKTGNDRIVPAGQLARVALEELVRGSNGRLVGIGTTQYWSHVRRAAGMADLPQVKRRPYALRHTFGTRLAELKVRMSVIGELMGHSDLRATAIYTVPSDQELRSAVELL